MASVDLVDETFIAAPNKVVADAVADPERWQVWFPRLRLTIFMDRGLKGIRWSVTGELVGSMEIWLEQFKDGVIVHYYLRVDPSDGPLPGTPKGYRQAAVIRVATAKQWKQHAWRLKDEMEAGTGA